MPQSTRFLLCGAAVAAALSGCTTLGPDFKAPAAPASQSYAMAGDAAAPGVRLTPETRTGGAWWTALGSPDLDHTVREALAGSPTLAEAEATLARAQAEVSAAKGGGDAQVSPNIGAQRERINTQAFGFTGFPSPTINLFSIGATVTYDLDLFGERRRTIEAAQARADAEARRADAAYLTLSGNVAMQAVRIATLRSQIATLQAIADDDRRVLDMIHKAQQAGGEAPSAISGGQAQLAQDEALLPPLQRQLAQARHQMALLVGKSPAEWTAPDFELASFTAPAETPVSLPSALTRRRPDILAAEADLHAATAQIGVATAAQYPDIRLAAGLTQSAIHPEDLFKYDSSGWNLGGSVVGPIIHSRRLSAEKKAAEAEARASLARYNGTVLRAFVQVSDVLSALANDQASLAALGRSQAASEASLRDARRAYDLGGGTLLQVIDAQRQLNRARRETVQAQGQGYSDLVELFTATAADWRG
jgi:NodT family efflux transporter outer membrane factor (OMF) lipoprotein